jgi:hypothetical protein
MASITTWHRLVPISRSSDFETALAAEIRDPLWLLSRQRQTGEMRGEDTGSPAFVRIGYKATALNDVILTPADGAAVTVPLDLNKPIEQQILAEPHTPDLATRAELGLTFFQIVDEVFGSGGVAVRDAFLAADGLAPPVGATFDPLDPATSAFALMTVGHAVDGVKVYRRAKAPVPTVPPGLTSAQTQILPGAYGAFVQWVEAVFGAIAPDDASDPNVADDPQGWNRRRLDYDIKMRFGAGNAVTLAVHPNENGSVDWSSFDVESTSADPFPASLPVTVAREVPGHVRFPGMPAPRFWDFEGGDLPWPDLDVTRTELARLLVVDFAMLYGVDWFVVPLALDVGNAVKIDSLVVFDVFGGRTVIDRVEEGRKLTPPDRFTLYGAAAPNGDVGSFAVLPPAAGRALQHGPVMEEVRFGRDEVANMAWGIEAVTSSRIGEPRRGVERDAAVDAAAPPAPPPPPTLAPLRYQIESKVPVHWIPLLIPDTNGAATTELEKGATLRTATGDPVLAVGKILNPDGPAPYRLFEEEVPKGGVRVERLVYGARARDGKSYLWVARRKRSGSGETQSGLRFDAALPTEK